MIGSAYSTFTVGVSHRPDYSDLSMCIFPVDTWEHICLKSWIITVLVGTIHIFSLTYSNVTNGCCFSRHQTFSGYFVHRIFMFPQVFRFFIVLIQRNKYLFICMTGISCLWSAVLWMDTLPSVSTMLKMACSRNTRTFFTTALRNVSITSLPPCRVTSGSIRTSLYRHMAPAPLREEVWRCHPCTPGNLSPVCSVVSWIFWETGPPLPSSLLKTLLFSEHLTPPTPLHV